MTPEEMEARFAELGVGTGEYRSAYRRLVVKAGTEVRLGHLHLRGGAVRVETGYALRETVWDLTGGVGLYVGGIQLDLAYRHGLFGHEVEEHLVQLSAKFTTI